MAMILVGDQERKPCAPAHPGRARHLLNRGRAAVLRRYPFTLILKAGERAEAADPLRFKIDPGSKTTGLALVKDATGQVVWADWRCGPTGGAGEGVMQHHDRQGDRARHLLDLLPTTPARRWLHLHERSGACSPGLRAGVSAPQM